MSSFGKIIVQRKNGGDGSQFVLTAISCLIGRDNNCDIRLKIDGVSNEHCQLIVRENKEVYLANLSKHSPTLRNGIPVINPVPLQHLDVFTVGSRSFRWEFPSESLHFMYTKVKNILESESPSIKSKTLARSVSRKTPIKIKSPRSSVTPNSLKRYRKSSLIAMEKMSADSKSNRTNSLSAGTPAKNVQEKIEEKKSPIVLQKPLKSKKIVQKPLKSVKVVSTKIRKRVVSKKIKVSKMKQKKKIGHKSPTKSAKATQDESLSNFATPNITRDVFVSPLSSEKTPSSIRSSAKRKSATELDILTPSGKMVKLPESALLKRKSSGARSKSPPSKQKLSDTPLPRKLTAKQRKALNKKKQNSPKSDYTKVGNLKRLFKEDTPLPDYTDARGLKRLFNDTTPNGDYTKPEGVKRLFKKASTPDYSNVSDLNLLDTPQSAKLNTPAGKNLITKTPKSALVNKIVEKALRSSLSNTDPGQSQRKSLRLNSPMGKSVASPLLRTGARSTSKSPKPQPERSSLTSNRRSPKSPLVEVTPRSLQKPLKRLSSSPSPASPSTKRLSLTKEKSPKFASPLNLVGNTSLSSTDRLSFNKGKSPKFASPLNPVVIESFKEKSPKIESPLDKVVNSSAKKGKKIVENDSPADENVNSSNKAVTGRQARVPRQSAKKAIASTPSPKVFSPRKTRSATTKTPKRVKTPEEKQVIVKATPTRRARKPIQKKLDEDLSSPATSPQVEVAKSKSTKTKKESAKTTKRVTKASPSKSTKKTPTKAEEIAKFEPELSPIVEQKTPSATRTRRRVVAATSPVERVLRRSKRT